MPNVSARAAEYHDAQVDAPRHALANAFSKNLANHLQALSLYFMHYNFCRPPVTLTKAVGGIHTPPQSLRVTDRGVTIAGIVALLTPSSN